MPIQTYRCPVHGEFEVMVSIKVDVPASRECSSTETDPARGPSFSLFCNRESPWVPPTVSFPGGPTTGARPPYVREDDDA